MANGKIVREIIKGSSSLTYAVFAAGNQVPCIFCDSPATEGASGTPYGGRQPGREIFLIACLEDVGAVAVAAGVELVVNAKNYTVQKVENDVTTGIAKVKISEVAGGVT